MGDSYLADIPGNAFVQAFYNLPSRASNAADSSIPLFVPRQAGRILSVDHIPLASQAGSATNFATISIVNLGTAGTGTTQLASRAYSATAQGVPAGVAGPLTVGSAPVFDANHMLAVSYASSGAGLALVAHNISIVYQLT